MVKVSYALLSPHPLRSGFDDIRAAAALLDGVIEVVVLADSLRISRDDGGDLLLQKADITVDSPYAAVLLFHVDLQKFESSALVWEVMIAVCAEQCGYDVWNAEYPAGGIARYAELRPLTILGIHGYVMRPPEFLRLAEGPPYFESPSSAN